MKLSRFRRGRRILSTAGIAAGLIGASLTASVAAATAAPGEGTWQMAGYGTIMTVGKGRAQFYESTAISCRPGPEYERRGRSYIAFGQQSFALRVQGTTAEMQVEGSVGKRQLRRIATLPKRCNRPGATGSLAVFDEFWTTYSENYPFFRAKGVDWGAVRAKYRPLVTPEISDAALFDLLAAMIRPLGDAHTAIQGDDRQFVGVRPGTLFPTEELEARIRPYIEKTTLNGTRITTYGNERIGYAQLPGRIGYLRIIAFMGYSGDPGYVADRQTLDRALDAILATKPSKLVLDLRINGGGSDQLALALAGRLTGQPYFAYFKRARNDPGDPATFTAPERISVTPGAGRRFTGPLVLLTGGSQMSAGETFTMALMNRTPRPVRVGENTQGVFSDTMQRTLPNGWRFILPNEEYRSRSWRSFDGGGVPPDLRRPVFTSAEFENGRDSAFATALTLLGRRH